MKRLVRLGLCTGVCMVTLAASLVGMAEPAASAHSAHEQPALLVRAGTSNDVYLVTSTGCVGAKCMRLYRTTVHASHFTQVSAPPVQGENGGIANTTLVRLVFANEDIGYAEVGRDYPIKLYETLNGARTWRQVALPSKTDLLNIAVTSDFVYATTARCRNSEGNCIDYRVWRSSLALHHWSELPTLWRTGTGPTETYYGPIVSALGHTVWEQETGNKNVYLWTSHNEGRTFSRVTTAALASVAGCYLTPTSTLDMWAECPTGLEVSFFDSHDGGAQWNSISRYTFSGTGGGTLDPISPEIAYLDYGLVSVHRYNFFRLTDGGSHVTVVAKLRCSSVSLLFTNTSDGLADCGENYTSYQLERTIDGGSSWRKVSLP
jgi:hypothetical protein